MIDAFRVIERAWGEGISLTVEGANIIVEPARLLSPELRAEIVQHKPALLRILPGANLVYLVGRVARFYNCPPAEVAAMKALALENPDSAWRCFLETVRIEGIQ